MHQQPRRPEPRSNKFPGTPSPRSSPMSERDRRLQQRAAERARGGSRRSGLSSRGSVDDKGSVGGRSTRDEAWEEKRLRFEAQRRRQQSGGPPAATPGSPAREPPSPTPSARRPPFDDDEWAPSPGRGYKNSPVTGAHSLSDVRAMRASLDSRGREGSRGRTPTREGASLRDSIGSRGRPSPVDDDPPSRTPSTPLTPQDQYRLELEQQMTAKKERLAREKREAEEWNRRKDAEAASFDYFGGGGRGGGGTPFRDADGNIITNLKEAKEAAGTPAPRRRGSVTLAPIDTHVSRGHPPPSPASTTNKSEYLRELEAQIAEKKARKEREKRDAEDWDRRKDAEAREYDYFASQKGGGGTPFRSSDGTVVSNLKEITPSADGTPAPSGPSARERLFDEPSGPPHRLPSVRGPSPRGGGRRSPPRDRDVSPSSPWSDSRGRGVRWDEHVSRPGSVASRVSLPNDPSEVVELYRDQNHKLKGDVAALEDKLEQALDLLERYRELYGPLPSSPR